MKVLYTSITKKNLRGKPINENIGAKVEFSQERVHIDKGLVVTWELANSYGDDCDGTVSQLLCILHLIIVSTHQMLIRNMACLRQVKIWNQTD